MCAKVIAMADDNDLMKLYSKRILALTTRIPHTQRIESPDATARKRSPLCGSTVSVDLQIEDGRITGYGQEVKACALGQAAASVIGASIIGLTHDDVLKGRTALRAMLKEDGPAPTAPFAELEVLMPAREFKNRHASILLTFDAINDAFAQAEEQAASA
jgi:NifU-like protein involved in Fe-S cluster formation